jgi:GGDEF domain-containing protein
VSASIQHDHLADLSHAVAAYLNIMGATADCLEQAFPDAGGPYRQRIHRLRARVGFDATREAIHTSSQTLQDELKDYSGVVSRILTQRSVELERGILALGDFIDDLNQLQQIQSNRIESFATRLENIPFPADAHSFSEAMVRQSTGLRSLAGEMTQETASLLASIREQMADIDRRLAGAASTDPVTGLINRRELNRQIEAHSSRGSVFTLLLFELSGPISDQVLRLAGAKLASHFRHNDRIARWGAREFAVLFMGGPDLAQTRAAQVVPVLSGRYTLDNGESVLVEAVLRNALADAPLQRA